MQDQLAAVVAFYSEHEDEDGRLAASALGQLELERREAILDAARLVEAEPSLIGASHHSLVVARRPPDA